VAEVSESKVARPYLGENLPGSETILLVEDAEAIRKLAAEFLSSHGFEVLSASNAEEAVSIATAHAGAIQLLVTDVIMPGQNGRVLAERLVASYPRIKVLYISGYTDSFIAGHGVLGADSNLLNKPFTEEALIHKVRDVLDSSKRARIKDMGMARILIVDDDEAIRRLVRLNLTDLYEVFDTGQPEETLALALEHKPDAILLDLRMLGYSGYAYVIQRHAVDSCFCDQWRGRGKKIFAGIWEQRRILRSRWTLKRCAIRWSRRCIAVGGNAAKRCAWGYGCR
jgi:CheY-like chemotaxis protein